MGKQTREFSALLYFSDWEARMVEAATARILPGSPEDPGAREAGVVDYIDRSLAGALQELQLSYRNCIRSLDAYARRKTGESFLDLDEASQDAILTDMEKWSTIGVEEDDHAENHAPSSAEAAERRLLGFFFTVLREHTLEGMFCDPAYGGNRDAVGWKMIGFPGAYYGYEEYQGLLGYDATQLPIVTLQDLRRQHAEAKSSHHRRQEKGAP